jgi:twitching motility protein PilT
VNLLDSLVDAIVRLEGDALVMHVGEKPYVVTTSAAMSVHRGPLAWGQVELSSRVLTSDAVLGMIAQILPGDLRQSLDAFGAVEHELLMPGDDARFTVVAARGGDDVWLELKRHPPAPVAQQTAVAKAVPEISAATSEAAPESVAAAAGAHTPIETPAAEALPEPAEESVTDVVVVNPPAAIEAPVIHEIVAAIAPQEAPPSVTSVFDTVEVRTAHAPMVEDITPGSELSAIEEIPEIAEVPRTEEPVLKEVEPVERVHMARVPKIEAAPITKIAAAPVPIRVENVPAASRASHPEAPAVEKYAQRIEKPGAGHDAGAQLAAAASVLLGSGDNEPLPVPDVPPALEAIDISEMHVVEPLRSDVDQSRTPYAGAVAGINAAGPLAMPSAEPFFGVVAPAAAAPPTISVAEPVTAASEAVRMLDEREETPHAVVVPVGRMRTEPAPGQGEPTVDGEALLRILRLAANRGASVVYIVAQSRPMVRVDGEIAPLEEEAVLTSADVALFIDSLGAMIDDNATDAVEWLSDVPEVGRVRHLTFHDHRGPGIIFRMIPPRVISAEQLGLSAEVQALCAQPDGLVIVTGAAMSGKSTLLSAFVDLINHSRSDHVIAIESQIRFVHESHRSFVSQREVRGGSEAIAQAARRALREDPDVLFIEEMSSPDVAAVALEAATGGRLVFGSVEAPSATAAIDQLIDAFPAERRAQMRTALAGSLRGVVAQVLLRRLKGGRVAAREVLLNSHPIASLILEGKTVQLPAAMSGRRHGMMPLTDSLAALVRDGVVHLGEAYRKAGDRDALLAVLKREGIDTSFTERLA